MIVVSLSLFSCSERDQLESELLEIRKNLSVTQALLETKTSESDTLQNEVMIRSFLSYFECCYLAKFVAKIYSPFYFPLFAFSLILLPLQHLDC